MAYVRSQLWDFASGRWLGPIRPGLHSRTLDLLSAALAGPSGSAWAVGSAGKDAITALHGPALRAHRK